MPDEVSSGQPAGTTPAPGQVPHPVPIPAGCCFVDGQEPFPASEGECISVGGKWSPSPCPQQGGGQDAEQR